MNTRDTRTVAYIPEIAEGFGTSTRAGDRWVHLRFNRQSRLHPDLSATDLLQAALPDGAFARGGDLDDYEDGAWALEPDGLDGVMAQIVRGSDGQRRIGFYCDDVDALRRVMDYVDARGEIERTRFHMSVTRGDEEVLDATAFPEDRACEFGGRLEVVVAPGSALDIKGVHVDAVVDPRRVDSCTIGRINAEGRTSVFHSRIDAIHGGAVEIADCSIHFLMEGSVGSVSRSEIRSMWPGAVVTRMEDTTVYDANGVVGFAERCEFHNAGLWSQTLDQGPNALSWSWNSHGGSWVPGTDEDEEPDEILGFLVVNPCDCHHNGAPVADGREFHIKAD